MFFDFLISVVKLVFVGDTSLYSLCCRKSNFTRNSSYTSGIIEKVRIIGFRQKSASIFTAKIKKKRVKITGKDYHFKSSLSVASYR